MVRGITNDRTSLIIVAVGHSLVRSFRLIKQQENIVNIQLPWGGDFLDLRIPDSWDLLWPGPLSKPHQQETVMDESLLIEQTLDSPIAMAPLEAMDLKKKKILLIVDDNTRPTPAHRFFKQILDRLERAGADLGSIILMSALGIHTAMTQNQMEEKVGKQALAKITWKNHDAFDENKTYNFGTTSRGTPVELNRALFEADFIISLGLVEPHLWAGFGGGLKNILPGLASANCIGVHHALISRPPYLVNRVGMAPEDNSFRLDLEEACSFINAPIFCVNVCLDRSGAIVAAFSGDAVKVHRKGVEFNIGHSGRFLKEPVDGIIVNSFPMDFNFKQSMKGVANSLPALKTGGVVMGFLKAENGLDDIVLPDRSLPQWLLKRILRLLGPRRTLWFLETVKPGINVEEKFLLYYSMHLIRQYELLFHVPTLGDHEVKRLAMFKQFHHPQEVIDRAAGMMKTNSRVAVFPEAGATFPILDQNQQSE
jgi:nickel-dependent lactate racemase